MGSGVGFLVHGWLAAIVGGHDEADHALGDAVDDLDELLFDTARRGEIRRRGYPLPRSLGHLRRMTAPMREVGTRLVRDDGRQRLFDDTIFPYLHDVAERATGAAETVDGARDHVNGILETNLAEQGNELNIITRKLASWAAIIAVPTAVTGFYGQNVPCPGISQPRGSRRAHS